MPAPTQCDELLDAVRESGVVEEKRLDSFLKERSAESSLPEEPRDLAEEMIQAGLITPFQKDLFLQGKRRGFILDDKYILLGHLGAGGMGTVYLCEHKVMRRRVALKVLPTEFAKDPEYLDRFHREARAAAALDHPNIVRAHDAGHDGKMHFLVMEYIEGASLHEIVSREGPLDIKRATDYICQAARGLEHAHEAGLVHRDIKPGNLLVDRKGTVKVLDMGLALFFKERESLTKQYDALAVLGTADFLAPEQAIDSHAVDIRADIYSLGLTFFFLLTGKNIYGEGTIAQKLLWHQMREVKPIRDYRPEVPEGLSAIISKMIAKDRADRYQSPKELIAALTPWVTGTGSVQRKGPATPGLRARDDAPTQGNGEELTLETPRSTPTTSPGSDRKAPVNSLQDAIASLQPVTKPASDRRAPAEMRTLKSVRPDREEPGSKRAGQAKAGKPSVDPDSKTALTPKGPRTPSRPRRAKTKRSSQHRLILAVILGSLFLAVGLVVFALVIRKGNSPHASSPSSANPEAGQVATATNPASKSGDAKGTEATTKTAKPPEPAPKGPEPSKTAVKLPDPPKQQPTPAPPKPNPMPNPPQVPVVKKPPQSLTDYFPKHDAPIFYDIADYSRSIPAVIRQKWDFKEDGVIECTNIKKGTLQGSPLLKGGTVNWLQAVQHFDKILYRVHDGFMELGSTVTIKQKPVTFWRRILPLAAAEGDEWKQQRPDGETIKFAVAKFEQYKTIPAVVIRESVAFPPDEVVSYHLFVKGIGEVSMTQNLEQKGKVVRLLTESKMVED